VLHAAPAAYRRMSTRDLVQSVDASVLRDGRSCFWSNSKPSFLFYAGLEDAPTFHGSRPGDLDALLECLRSDRTVYCLVSGERRLAQLRRACADGFRVVAAEGECLLVTNDKTTHACAAATGAASSTGGGK